MCTLAVRTPKLITGMCFAKRLARDASIIYIKDCLTRNYSFASPSGLSSSLAISSSRNLSLFFGFFYFFFLAIISFGLLHCWPKPGFYCTARLRRPFGLAWFCNCNRMTWGPPALLCIKREISQY